MDGKNPNDQRLRDYKFLYFEILTKSIVQWIMKINI